MNESDKEQFTIMVSALAEAHRREASKALLMAYWFALRDLPLGDFERAVQTSLCRSKFMPSPAELRELSGGAMIDDRAVIAWQFVVEAVTRLGPYRHVDFDDRVINAAIRTLGGWPEFISRFASAEAERLARNDFLRLYRSLAHSEVAGTICEPLAGLSQTRLVQGRLLPPEPVRVATGLAQVPGLGGGQRRLELGTTLKS